MRRRAGLLAALLAIACGATTPAQAADPQTVLRDWMGRHGAKAGILAVARDDRLLLEAGIGSDVDAVVPLASLSKAITAVCIGRLVGEGRLRLEARLREALATFFAKHGPPADGRTLDITVAQLLGHRSGLGEGAREAIGPTLLAHLQTTSAREAAMEPLLARALKRKLGSAPGETYRYSNIGYLALGVVASEATGQPYDAACRTRALEPMGVKGATLSSNWRVMSSWGGWNLKARDYLAFFRAMGPMGDAVLPASVRAWRDDPAEKGRVGHSFYSLGVLVLPGERGRVYTHTGSWTWSQTKGADGAMTESYGAFARRMADGLSWFVHYRPLPKDHEAARDELIRAIAPALRGVTQWPIDRAMPKAAN
jgi:CubicO group peptidase (beta-lactamase class C family)